MNNRLLAVSVAVLGLVGCKEKAAPAATTTPVLAAPAKEAAAAEVRTESGKGGKAPAGQAEVELFGKLDFSKAPGKKVVLYVSKEACDSAAPTVLGSVVPSNPGPPTFFLEFFPAQGATGYLCGVSLDDKGQVVGAAASAKNPLTFSGGGEVVFDKLDMTLEPVNPPRPAPKF